MNAELIDAVKALPRDEKVRLIGEVWASLDDSFDPPLSSAQQTELTRRLKAYVQDPGQITSWDDVKGRGRQILREMKNSAK